MRAFFATLYIVALCVGCGGETTTEEKPAPATPAEPKSASTDAGVEKNDDGETKIEGPVVIDVRSQEEWNEGHIDGAIHIPHDVIGDKIAEHVTDKTAEIKFY